MLFAGRRFDYLRCPGCRSLVCEPMPDDEVLAALYDMSYAGEAETPAQADYDAWVLDRLAGRPAGRFIDYGCGNGRLLQLVAAAGWDAVGVEYDPDVARSVSARIGVPIVTVEASGQLEPADVLHLGDVLEHLTDLPTQLPAILHLLHPGGTLLAQGPLEANPNLFDVVVRLAAIVRPGPTSAPPYHVVQATTEGQVALLDRHGLVMDDLSVFEVAWPAPPTRPAIRDTRGIALWALRRASMAVTAVRGGRAGNRYRYAGHRPGSTP